MAWIKMRIDLQTHPKVVRILSAIRRTDVQAMSDKFRVIGGIHAVWSVFDTHSIDGVLEGYTPEILDHVVGFNGIAAAMIDVEWLHYDGSETLVMPEFCEHNGKSAKRRAEDQKRKRNGREDVRIPSANEADKKRTREDKSKNSNKTYSTEFQKFWNAYPATDRKGGRPVAYAVWNKLHLDDKADVVIEHMNATIATRELKWVPAPKVYLNQQGWDGWGEVKKSEYEGVV